MDIITPPPGTVPQNLGIGSYFFLGANSSAVAAVIEATGGPGIRLDRNESIAHAAAAIAREADGQHGYPLPAVVVLASPGQKAAIKTLRSAGLRVFYAIPPSHAHGGPKGSGWEDYPREGISDKVLCAHLALAIVHRDRHAHAMLDDLRAAWRPSIEPHTPAQAGATHEVRADLQTALQKTVSGYLDWMDDKPFAPVLMMPTTGTGKSTAAKSLIRHVELRQGGGRVCVFVPDHLQAQEYENEGFFHFWGRNPEPDHPGYCPNHSTCQEAMDKGHISQAEMCHQCSNGYRWAVDHYGEVEGKKAQERVEEAKDRLRSRGLDWRMVTPCVWQDHLRDALDTQFVVAASGSYSHSLTRAALAIFDEHFEPGKGISVTLQDVDHWTRRNQIIVENLAKSVQLAAEKDRDDLEKLLAAHRKAGEFFKWVALAMAGWAGKTGSISVDSTLLESIQGILEVAKKHKDDVALAAWETLKFNSAGEMSDNPLRAAHAIAESLKFGDGYVTDGQLVVAASLPVMERLASGQPTVIMDATPDPVVVDVVRAQGGVIVNAIARQNVRIVRHPTRFWGLTPLNIKRAGADRVQREVAKYKAIMAHHEGAACLFHKRATDKIDPKEINPMLGHWGRHHRAHNAWTGRPLVIVGSFFPPLEAWRAEYQVSRIAALSAGANAENWPVWPDDLAMVKDEWICEGAHDVPSQLPLPIDPQIRQWLLNRVASETVQAIGRARGANAENTIDVHIYGGVPLHGLWQHGLAVAEYADDPECLGLTKAEHMDAMAQERRASLGRVDNIAARVIAKGRTVTRQTLQDEVNAMLDEAAAAGDESYLWGGGIYIHSTPPQIQKIQMVDTAVVQEWIATRMPILSQHLSTKGRNGGLVKAAQQAAAKFGEEMLMEALQMADLLFRATSGDAGRLREIAWDTIEYEKATDTEVVAAGLVLDATMDKGKAEEVASAWDLEEMQS